MTNYTELLAKVETYYSGALERHGATPQGADWSSGASQRLRFHELSRLWSAPVPGSMSVLDYGCGYGALVAYLREGVASLEYTGFDISAAMIAAARKLYGAANVRFTESASLQPVDYVVASGIFNVKLDTPEETWRSYVIETMIRMNGLAKKGFAFNMLSHYSDPPRRRPDLFYGDPLFFFDYCKNHFSTAVALLHDYPLYEFTVLVRRQS